MRHLLKHFVKIATVLAIIAIVFSLCAPAYALLPDPDYQMSSSYKSGKYYQNLINVQLTGDMRKDIVAVARSQYGYMEGNSSSSLSGESAGGENCTEYANFYTYYSNKYYGDHYNYQRNAWCGMFVSFCAYMAKIPSTVMRLSAETAPWKYGLYGSNALQGSNYKTLYDLKVKGGSYVPQPGDIIFFGRSASTNPTHVTYCHLGIIESVDIKYDDSGKMSMVINTFEGNSSDKVNNKHWTVKADSSGYIYSNTYIAGFGIPNYTTDLTSADPVYEYDIGAYAGSLLREGSKGLEVYKLQHALSLLKLAGTITSTVTRNGTLDDKTKTAVLEYQTKAKLEVDALVGRDTWTSLRQAVNTYVTNYDDDFIIGGSTLLLYKGDDRDVEIPDGCKTVAALSFAGTKIKTLTTPIGLKAVEGYAFKDVSSLTSVIHRDSRAENEKVAVAASGNDAYRNATHTFNTPTYQVIFDLGTEVRTKFFELGSIPVYDGPEPTRPDPKYIYCFIGWDRPFTAVTEETTYSAQFIKLSAKPMLTPVNVTVTSGNEFSLEIMAGNFKDVSSFSFDVNYQEYADMIHFIGYDSEVENVSVDNLGGSLRVTKDAGYETLSGDASLIKLNFTITDDTLRNAVLNFNLTTGADQGIFVSSATGLYPLPCNVEIGTVTVDRAKPVDMTQDYNNDGFLNVDDVSLLLDMLAGQHEPTGGINAGTSVADVSRLLDQIAGL